MNRPTPRARGRARLLIGGTYRPAGSLATFDGGQMQGTWTLKVQDVYTNDGGSLNGWQLQICRTPPAGDPLAFIEYAYDGQAVGAAPLKGNQTLTRAYSQVTPTVAYVDTTTAYDTWGRPVTVTDPDNHTTTTAYHAFYGYAQSVTNALNQTSSTVVDPGWGAPTSVTDLNGRVSTAQYDAFGRLIKVWLPSEPTSGPASKEFVYAADQRPAWIKTRQLNDAATSSYLEGWGYFDGFGRSLQSQAPLANGNRSVTATGYNALGQTAYSSAPYEVAGAAGSGYVTPTWTNLANYAYTTYDELGRTVRNETRSGATQLWATRATYDVWTTASYDANDHRQDAVTDAFDQTVQVKEYNNNGTYTTNYAYDLAGRLTGVTDAANNVTAIGYDLLGRKTGMTDPDMGSWQYGYDSAGNLTSQRDGAQRWLYLEYDALNRLMRKRQDSASGPILAEWQYDAAGQLGLPSRSLAYSSQGATEAWTVAYDALNRPLQQQTTVPGAGGGVFRLDTTYTTAGQRATLRYPGGNAGQQGEIVTFGYNAVGQLTTVTSDDGTQYVASTTYNAQGQVTEQRLDSGANGFTRQSVYNANTLRLETLKAGNAAPFENDAYQPIREEAQYRLGIDKSGVGRVLGGYTVYVEPIHTQAGGMAAQFIVYNVMGRESGSRLLGAGPSIEGYLRGKRPTNPQGIRDYWPKSIFEDKSREETSLSLIPPSLQGWGGSITTVFIWSEPLRVDGQLVRREAAR